MWDRCGTLWDKHQRHVGQHVGHVGQHVGHVGQHVGHVGQHVGHVGHMWDMWDRPAAQVLNPKPYTLGRGFGSGFGFGSGPRVRCVRPQLVHDGAKHKHMRRFLSATRRGAQKSLNPPEIQNPRSCEALCGVAVGRDGPWCAGRVCRAGRARGAYAYRWWAVWWVCAEAPNPPNPPKPGANTAGFGVAVVSAVFFAPRV